MKNSSLSLVLKKNIAKGDRVPGTDKCRDMRSVTEQCHINRCPEEIQTVIASR